jgi:hypothetical protein
MDGECMKRTSKKEIDAAIKDLGYKIFRNANPGCGAYCYFVNVSEDCNEVPALKEDGVYDGSTRYSDKTAAEWRASLLGKIREAYKSEGLEIPKHLEEPKLRFYLYICNTGVGAHVGRHGDTVQKAVEKLFPLGYNDEVLRHVRDEILRITRESAVSFASDKIRGTGISVSVMKEDGIYFEVCVPRGGSPTFPDQCPVCGAPVFIKKVLARTEEVRYSCGGVFSQKDQIQTHTDKWWGRCGKFIKGDK